MAENDQTDLKISRLCRTARWGNASGLMQGSEGKDLDLTHFHVLLSRKGFSAIYRHMCYLGPLGAKIYIFDQKSLLVGSFLREIGHLFICFTFGLAK